MTKEEMKKPRWMRKRERRRKYNASVKEKIIIISN
tara:strand:+ start:352 stop:456 length:105 start_codon:yes stop_codon:yes gene_type:complete